MSIFSKAENMFSNVCFFLHKACTAKIDLVFMIEGDSSVERYGIGNFRRLIDFVRTMAVGFTISRTNTRLATVVYGKRPYKWFGFNKHRNIKTVYEALNQRAHYPRTAGCKTGKALSFVKRLFRNARRRASKVLVVLSDGRSLDDVHVPARILRSKGVTIFSVGVGRYFNVKELDSMATDPDKNHVFTSDWKQLQHIVNDMKKAICLGRYIFVFYE